MKIEIKDYCIRCGICLALHEKLFRYNEEKDRIEATMDEVPADLVEDAKSAAADCAVTVIFLHAE